MCNKSEVWFCLFALQMRGIRIFDKDWNDIRKKNVKIQETEGVRSQARRGDGVRSGISSIVQKNGDIHISCHL